MELPDCENLYSDTFTLSELERERLIELLVKKGEKGLDEFLASESLSVRSKVEEIRKLLEEQAKRIREKIEGRFKTEESAQELKWEAEKSGQGLSEDEREYLKKSGKLLDRELSMEVQEVPLAQVRGGDQELFHEDMGSDPSDILLVPGQDAA